MPKKDDDDLPTECPEEDRSNDKVTKYFEARLTEKDNLISILHAQILELTCILEKKETAVEQELQTVRSEYDDIIALNQFEYTTEINCLKTLISRYEESSTAFELKSRILKHNEDLLTHVQYLKDALLFTDQGSNDRSTLLIEDFVLSMMHNGIELRDPKKHISISEVACQMGFRFTRTMLASVGIPIAKRYKRTTGENPSKHSQFVDGKVNMVNSYTDESREMIQEELRKAWGS